MFANAGDSPQNLTPCNTSSKSWGKGSTTRRLPPESEKVRRWRCRKLRLHQAKSSLKRLQAAYLPSQTMGCPRCAVWTRIWWRRPVPMRTVAKVRPRAPRVPRARALSHDRAGRPGPVEAARLGAVPEPPVCAEPPGPVPEPRTQNTRARTSRSRPRLPKPRPWQSTT